MANDYFTRIFSYQNTIFFLVGTGKSFSEAVILPSTNPQFDKRCNSMNNLLLYCGLVDARISSSDKDLPLGQTSFSHLRSTFLKLLVNTNLIFCKVQFRSTYVHSTVAIFFIRFPVSNSKNKSILPFESCVKNHKAEIWNEQMNKTFVNFYKLSGIIAKLQVNYLLK